MCVASTPKVNKDQPKDPAIIRNPFLDGIDPTMKALRLGRSALRIERGSGRVVSTPLPSAPLPTLPAPVTPPPITRPPTTPTTPYIGGGTGRVSRSVGGGRGVITQ